ncbi:uncharacterized protein B0H64DRAFT_242639 [Chaetomium fimeti]|uniref:DUF7924 domain-containing protein n=1 Tax=Chaetomium fimeti TaxID=1854472 RepID=A0AAE0H8Z6_9PEZI|nr:hypothetical protein B0H64DRAFT_242639 [Chaetomium fimeti]
MDGRISKARHRHSRSEPSKALQGKLLNAATGKSAETLSKDRPHEATPEPVKRPFKTCSHNNPSLVKRIRLMHGQANKTALQQPKPTTPRQPHASFPEDFGNPNSLTHPRSRESTYTHILDWLESVEPGRTRYCRSDTQLHRLGEPIPKQLTRSAPEMATIRDLDGFVLPSTPASAAPRSNPGTLQTGSAAPSNVSHRSSVEGLVEKPVYRDVNLAANNIYLLPRWEQLPDHIADIVRFVGTDRDSPGLSTQDVAQDVDLDALWTQGGESEVEEYCKHSIFPRCHPTDVLRRSDRQPMARDTVPNSGSNYKVSNPVPDMLYGYNRQAAFPQQQTQLIFLGSEMIANSQGLVYPFFVIEFKGDGPSGAGSFWVATNQCLGGSASCVNIADRLNRRLAECDNKEISAIDSATFSIAMSGSEARLCITWKHDELAYHMANVKNFLLHDPDHHIQFRKYVRNIIDWGKGRRLDEIRSSLDALSEESRKTASEDAKSCFSYNCN